MSGKDNFESLIENYIQGTLSPSEKQAFFELFRSKDIDPELEEYLWQNYQQNIDKHIWPIEFRNRFSGRLAKNVLEFSEQSQTIRISDDPEEQSLENIKVKSAHRTHFLRTAWFKYAAAILITLSTVSYLWINTRNARELVTTNGNNRLQTDIAPGGEKAVLTLADGTKIILDDAANGNLAQQGNAQVVKLSDGQVVYNLQGKSDNEVRWNTMSTPAGGQYQVTLPDGTKVWLNAASSITYPTAFVGKNRPVKISGEVYFGVAKNNQKPFVVDVDGKSLVEVLGTTFNINSYANEGSIKTTLLDGSVKVISYTTVAAASSDRQPGTSRADDGNKSSVILMPGQQAQINATAIAAGIVVNSNVDMDKALAWKNGLFNFNGSDLRSVMRQLERWYDIKVKYEGPVSNDIFKGEMYRNVNLSDVLDMLREMDVKFRMEGKTLIVTG